MTQSEGESKSRKYPDISPARRTVKEMDADDKPRERALKYGIGSLATADLFAIILRTGVQGVNVMDMCRNILASAGGNLHALARKTYEDILHINGVGPAKALQVLAVMEILKRYAAEELEETPVIRDSNIIYRIMEHVIGNLDHEEMWALFLSRSNKVIHKCCVTTGSAVATVFDMKGILKMALAQRAEGVVLCHNHPSGSLLPSREDDNITRRFQEACKIMELRFLDHLIVTSKGFYSYHDQSRIL